MKRTKPLLICAIVVLATSLLPLKGDLCAQCYGSLMLSPGFFEFDFLVRVCVHFGDISSLPEDVQCCRCRVQGETPIEFPICAYNLHEGIERLEFTIESNDSLAVFSPESYFSIISSVKVCLPGYYRMDLILEACQPLCGPVLVGYAQVIPVTGEDPVWVELVPNRQTKRMIATDMYCDYHYLFSPHHGGYVGNAYLYACQRPLCDEPNMPVEDFYADIGKACAVKLIWRAGGGNRTVIRYRTDRYPTGYEDGELALELDSAPGESQYFYHTNMPRQTLIYYKAFSITRDAGGFVVRDSFVECSSADTVFTDCQIAAEPASWGAIKKKFK
ncbi:MAG: hypothetical protein KAX38_02455 [Candidatus Krumholzibacteria bacterium]|nr:hypothetical protein [Candidatus Krumholzibacteria bacterium]